MKLEYTYRSLNSYQLSMNKGITNVSSTLQSKAARADDSSLTSLEVTTTMIDYKQGKISFDG